MLRNSALPDAQCLIQFGNIVSYLENKIVLSKRSGRASILRTSIIRGSLAPERLLRKSIIYIKALYEHMTILEYLKSSIHSHVFCQEKRWISAKIEA